MTNNGPVFAFTVHRSGSTLLGRLLNCHPNLIVWGEHSGIINKLAEIDFVAKQNQELRPLMNQALANRFINETDLRAAEFMPWTMPPHIGKIRAHAKNMILDVFGQNLKPRQRWGFKEIRYHRPYVAEYLLGLFPDARFILLQRDVVDASVSNILSEWSQDHVTETITRTVAEDIIRDVVYALLCFSAGFEKIEERFTGKAFTLNYNSLKSRDVEEVCRMFEFLGFDLPTGFVPRLRSVFAVKFNTTKKQPRENDVLTADFIRARAADMLPAIQAEIAKDGVDRARLVAETGIGKYSFLVGGKRSSYVRF